jgi:glycosyltransferase involved in cell wall biosynthesis
MSNEEKKIVIIGPAYPLRGGLATYNQILASHLQSKGHQVTVVTFKLQYPKILFPGKTQYSSDPAPEDLNIEVKINSISPINWIRVGNRIGKQKPDIVIFRYWMSFMGPCFGTIARCIKRKNKTTKLVAITDNIIPHEKNFFDTPFTQYFLKPMSGFVTMSKAVLEDLKKFNIKGKANYSPHPMYDSFGASMNKAEAKKNLGLNPEVNYLLFFGFIRKYKGLDLLLEAFADKRLKDKNIHLIIAGEYYDSPEKYKEIISRENLQERLIQCNDFIPDSEVSKYFCACDMVVQTYKDATQSGVTQIAYYYNKPMLVTNVGGLAELVPHNKVGYVVDRDKEKIADAILDFYENERYKVFSENVKRRKSLFSWKNLSETIFKSAGIE